MLKEMRLYAGVWCVCFVLCFVTCFWQKNEFYLFIANPVIKILQKPLSEIFIYTSVFESFTANVSLCLYSGFLLSLPVLIVCIYKFVAKSLYEHEKKVLKKLLCFSFFLGFCAVATAYFVILPRATEFFIATQNNIARPTLKIGEYVSTFFHIILGFAIIFQLPLVMVGLVKFGIIKPTFLSANRRISVVVIFIISAIITPPDVFSQVVCAFVLICLYELTNFYIQQQHRQQTKKKINGRRR